MKKELHHANKKNSFSELNHNINMSVFYNREVIFEGCKGVVEYTDQSIKLNTGKFLVAFNGRSMHIKSMTETNIIIVGFITSIEYIL